MQAEEIFINANHIMFAAKVWRHEVKEAHKTIIAIHGWLDNAASFDLLAPKLEGYRVIAIDLCGHGKSQHRPEGVPYHFVDYVADIFYIADVLELKHFHLLGHSLGGNISTTMAGTYPEKILSLSLLEGFGPVTRAIEETTLNLRESIEKFALNQSKMKRYAEFSSLVKARLMGRWPLSEQAAERLCERGSVEKDGKFTWSSDARINFTSPLRMTSQQASYVRSQITAPTLLIVGEQGIAPELKANQPPLSEFRNSEIYRMQGKHHLHMEDEHVQEVANEINRFLSTVNP